GTMLGQGAALPSDCRFVGGAADGAVATGEYRCGDSPVALELRHRDDAPPDAPRTEQFAIVLRRGQAPPALLAAVAALVRAHEAGFYWKQLAAPPSQRAPVLRIVAVAVAASGIVALGLALRFLLLHWLRAVGTRWRSGALSVALAVLSAV